MTDFRPVTEDIAVSPQIEIADLARAAAQGFKLVISNRPDGEEPGQPTAETVRTAAEAVGLAFVHIPVLGGPTPGQVEAVREAVAQADGPVLLFCRSGTRSIVTWSLGQAMSGAMARGELVSLGREAGYELSGVLGG